MMVGTRAHAHTQTSRRQRTPHAQTHACPHARTRTRTRIPTHAHTRAHIQARTNLDALVRAESCSLGREQLGHGRLNIVFRTQVRKKNVTRLTSSRTPCSSERLAGWAIHTGSPHATPYINRITVAQTPTPQSAHSNTHATRTHTHLSLIHI